MTIERARILLRPMPWGVADISPWSAERHGHNLIGELSYERADRAAPATSLLLKLLFTSSPLSIQVHPDDAYAKSIGLPHGKSEAWHVLDAVPGAKVALGLDRPVTRDELREAIEDRSIEQLVRWQEVKSRDTLNVPAGTIHAIGAGVIIAEIQQRSDITFRLFDHGRERELHTDDGIAVATLGRPALQSLPTQLSGERLLLVSSVHFIFERVALAANSNWTLNAVHETWLLVLGGRTTVASFDIGQGDAVFAQGECVNIQVGDLDVECLIAYTGRCGTAAQLLQRTTPQKPTDVSHAGEEHA